jgi:uncharacterized protein YggU (UPF0235/DUF167 family)
MTATNRGRLTIPLAEGAVFAGYTIVGSDGELTIYVREPAVDGKANDAVIRLLAAHLQLPRSRVELVSGATSRLKRFRIGR